MTVPAHNPPALRSEGEAVNPSSGLLVISIGYGTIELDIIRRSHAAFRDLREDRLRTYNYSGVVAGEQWQLFYGISELGSASAWSFHFSKSFICSIGVRWHSVR